MLGMIKNSLFGSVETWPWQVLSKGDKEEVSYEERACEGGKFATVEVTDKPVDEALREAMPKVAKYAGGTNDKGIGMGMTVPISFAVFPNEDGSLQKKLKVWFRIPNQFQSDPPAPSDKSVKIEEREGITVYSIYCRNLSESLRSFRPFGKRLKKLRLALSYSLAVTTSPTLQPKLPEWTRRR
uniref:Heme-binding protein 1 n=4 Tax=Catarrhini TaxID=9526 RepID=A0A8D2K6M9_THEGE